MTYNVFSGTLNPTHFTSLEQHVKLQEKPQACNFQTVLCKILFKTILKIQDTSKFNEMCLIYTLFPLHGHFWRSRWSGSISRWARLAHFEFFHDVAVTSHNFTLAQGAKLILLAGLCSYVAVCDYILRKS